MHGLRAFGRIFDFELNPLTLSKDLKTFSLNTGIVDEDVFAVFLRDESESLGLIEPLYLAVVAFGKANSTQIGRGVFNLRFASANRTKFWWFYLRASFCHASLFINREDELGATLGAF
jgi:hypothetical protein